MPGLYGGNIGDSLQLVTGAVQGIPAPIASIGATPSAMGVGGSIAQTFISGVQPGLPARGVEIEPQVKQLRVKPVWVDEAAVAAGAVVSVDLGVWFDSYEIIAMGISAWTITTPNGDVTDLTGLVRDKLNPAFMTAMPKGTYHITNVSGGVANLGIQFNTFDEVT